MEGIVSFLPGNDTARSDCGAISRIFTVSEHPAVSYAASATLRARQIR